MEITDALREAEAWMDEIDGVEGVAQGKHDDEDCITVFVSTEAAARKIPDRLHGYKIVIDHSGAFDALPR